MEGVTLTMAVLLWQLFLRKPRRVILLFFYPMRTSILLRFHLKRTSILPFFHAFILQYCDTFHGVIMIAHEHISFSLFKVHSLYCPFKRWHQVMYVSTFSHCFSLRPSLLLPEDCGKTEDQGDENSKLSMRNT